MIVNYFLLSYLRLFSSFLCIWLKEEYTLLFFILPLKLFIGRMPILSQLKWNVQAELLPSTSLSGAVELCSCFNWTNELMNSAFSILCRYSFTLAAVLKIFYQKSHYIEKLICLHILKYPTPPIVYQIVSHFVIFTWACTKSWKSQGFVNFV